MKPSILPACVCSPEHLYDDDDVHCCDVCNNFTLGERFGKPIDKFKESYDHRDESDDCRQGT